MEPHLNRIGILAMSLLLLTMPVASAQVGSMSHSNTTYKNQHATENKTTELTTLIYPTSNFVDMLENGRTVDVCGYTQSGQRGDCPTASAPQELYVRYEVPRNTSTGELIGFGDRVVFKVKNLGSPAYVDVDVNVCWTDVNDRTEIICEHMDSIYEGETEKVPMLSTKSDEWFIHIVAWAGSGGDETQVELSYTITSSNNDRTEPEELDVNSGVKDRVVCKVDCNDQNAVDPVDAYVIKAHEGDKITFKIGSRVNGGAWLEDFDACMTFRNEVTLSSQLVWNKICLNDWGDFDRPYIVTTVETTMTNGGYLYIWVWAGNDADEDKPEPYSIEVVSIDSLQRNWHADRDGDGLNDTHEEVCGSDFKDPADTAPDYDGDNTCDLLDEDDDNDGVLDVDDACTLSVSGTDYDSDGCTDEEDDDDDNDGKVDSGDDCQQGERDWDSTSPTFDHDGDGCKDETEDLDDDNDSWSDSEEATCISDSLDAESVPDNFDAYHESATESERQCDISDQDDDADGILDTYDQTCPFSIWYQYDPVTNSISVIDEDFDNDGCFNAEDSDDDNDNVLDVVDQCPFGTSSGSDIDGDGCMDGEDDDMDNDGFSNTIETDCESDPSDNSSTPVDIAHDNDQDGVCDTLDPDDDNDGLNDDDGDIFPRDASEQYDFDADGIGDNADNDDDNDETDDADDAFPKDASEQSDFDGDGIGDNQDLDDDGDNWLDSKELQCGSDPMNSANQPTNHDNDEFCDSIDNDDDNDNIPDVNDACPISSMDLRGTSDRNKNGCYDREDDSDGDQIMDYEDECPEQKGISTEDGCPPPEGFAKYQSLAVGSAIGLAVTVAVVVGMVSYFKRNSQKDTLEGMVRLAEVGVNKEITIHDNSRNNTSQDIISGHGIKAVDGASVAGESVVGGNQSNDGSKQNN